MLTCRDAYYDGPNRLDVRQNMAVGATWSIVAGTASPYGLVLHPMGYPLQGTVKTSHGRTIAVLLPYVMEFNLMTNLPKYARLAEIMGESTVGLSMREAALKSIDAVRNLSQDLGLPQRLRDIGIKKEQIADITRNLFMHYESRLRSNPRRLSQEDAARIYEAAW